MINPALLAKLMKIAEQVNKAQKAYNDRMTPENKAKLEAAVKEAGEWFKVRGPSVVASIQALMGKTALERADAIDSATDVSSEALAQLLEQLASRARTGTATLTALDANTFDSVALRLRTLAQENERLGGETFTAQAKDAWERAKTSEAGQKVALGLAGLRDRIKAAANKVD
jgi:hypothetical protein